MIALDDGRSAHWRLIAESAAGEPAAPWIADLRRAMAQTRNARARAFVRDLLGGAVKFPN